MREQKGNRKCAVSIKKKKKRKKKKPHDYSLLFVGQDQARVQYVVLRFPSAVPAHMDALRFIKKLVLKKTCEKKECDEGMRSLNDDSTLTHFGDHPCHFRRYSTLP